MDVLEQGIFADPRDVLKLNIVDWGRLNGAWSNVAAALDTVANWLVGKAAYTIVRYDLGQAPARDDWPGWQHEGNTHEALGRLYWNTFHAAQSSGALVSGSELRFTDEPDFHGVMAWSDTTSARFWGDIGQVSASCFAMTLKSMRAGDLWISVLDEHRQVIIEALGDNPERWAATLGMHPPTDPREVAELDALLAKVPTRR